MAKISVSFEKTIRTINGELQTQELVIWAQANSKQEAEELGYNDFHMDLYVNGNYVADISYVLGKTNAYEELIDHEDWAKIYADAKEEQRTAHVTVYEQIHY